MTFRTEVSLLHSRISAKELLGPLQNIEPDALIVPREHPRWERLRSGVDPEVNLRARAQAESVSPEAFAALLNWAYWE